MSIQADLSELKGLEKEIKILSKRLKGLRKRKKELDARVTAYIRAKELPGVKHRGTAVLIEEKTKRAPKSNKDRDRDAIRVLEERGIRDADLLFRELMEARKGEEIVTDKLKMKKYDNDRY